MSSFRFFTRATVQAQHVSATLVDGTREGFCHRDSEACQIVIKVGGHFVVKSCERNILFSGDRISVIYRCCPRNWDCRSLQMSRFRPGRRQRGRRFRFLGFRRACGGGRPASGARVLVTNAGVVWDFRRARNRGTRPSGGRVVRDFKVDNRSGIGIFPVMGAGICIIFWLIGVAKVRGHDRCSQRRIRG